MLLCREDVLLSRLSVSPRCLFTHINLPRSLVDPQEWRPRPHWLIGLISIIPNTTSIFGNDTYDTHFETWHDRSMGDDYSKRAICALARF